MYLLNFFLFFVFSLFLILSFPVHRDLSVVQTGMAHQDMNFEKEQTTIIIIIRLHSATSIFGVFGFRSCFWHSYF